MLKEIRFYHLQRQPIEAALPKLLEKVLEAGMTAVVRVPEAETLKALDAALWTYDPASFLPHGTAETGHAARQPVYLTIGEERPNDAAALVLVNNAPVPAELSAYERCLYMFDGSVPEIVERARADWKALKDRAAALSYWQQTPQGGWEQKA